MLSGAGSDPPPAAACLLPVHPLTQASASSRSRPLGARPAPPHSAAPRRLARNRWGARLVRATPIAQPGHICTIATLFNCMHTPSHRCLTRTSSSSRLVPRRLQLTHACSRHRRLCPLPAAAAACSLQAPLPFGAPAAGGGTFGASQVDWGVHTQCCCGGVASSLLPPPTVDVGDGALHQGHQSCTHCACGSTSAVTAAAGSFTWKVS